MLDFSAYLLAGLLTVCDVLYLLTWSTWGGQIHFLEFVALAAGALLILTAYLSLWRPHVAAQLAFGGALTGWAFYLPAIRTTIAGTTLISLSSRAGIFAALAILFLLFATILSALRAFSKTPAKGASKRGRLLACFSTALLMTVIGGATLVSGRTQTPQSFDLIFPDGYRGWVRIDFGSPTAPPLPMEDGAYRVVVPPSGVVQTATRLPKLTVLNRYSYVKQDGTVPVQRAFCVRRAGTKTRFASEYILVGDQSSQSKGQASEPSSPEDFGRK